MRTYWNRNNIQELSAFVYIDTYSDFVLLYCLSFLLRIDKQERSSSWRRSGAGREFWLRSVRSKQGVAASPNQLPVGGASSREHAGHFPRKRRTWDRATMTGEFFPHAHRAFGSSLRVSDPESATDPFAPAPRRNASGSIFLLSCKPTKSIRP